MLPSTLKEIGEGAFACCYKLKRVVLPEGIRKIGDHAFDCCSSMVEINFPTTLEQIGEEAFARCRSLYAHAPNHVPQVGGSAFYGCHSMADSNGMTIVKNMLHNYCGTARKVKIPDEVEYIADYCFAGKKEIEEIELPKTLKKIGTCQHTCCSYTFRGCSGLADENGFVIVGGCLWDYIGDVEIVEIPENVTMVHEKAICGSKNGAPKTVIVPATVTHVSEKAFESVNVHFLGAEPESCSEQLSLCRYI